MSIIHRDLNSHNCLVKLVREVFYPFHIHLYQSKLLGEPRSQNSRQACVSTNRKAKVDKHPKTSYVRTLEQERENAAKGEESFTILRIV